MNGNLRLLADGKGKEGGDEKPAAKSGGKKDYAGDYGLDDDVPF